MCWQMNLCEHIMITAMKKNKTGSGKGTKKCQGWATIVYRNVSKSLIRQATFDQRPKGKKRASPEDARLRSRSQQCKDRRKHAEHAWGKQGWNRGVERVNQGGEFTENYWGQVPWDFVDNYKDVQMRRYGRIFRS